MAGIFKPKNSEDDEKDDEEEPPPVEPDGKALTELRKRLADNKAAMLPTFYEITKLLQDEQIRQRKYKGK